MKNISIAVLFSIIILESFGQKTNVKTGFWSDNTIWSNNTTPNYADDIVLNFDIIVDINATCKSLITNGHNVIVNSGVKLNVLGTNISGVDSLNTDTTVIFTKKTVFHYGQNDSSMMVYRNNTLNGIKGYLIIDSSLTQNYTSTITRFYYNNFGHLKEIVNSENTQQQKILSTLNLIWEENKIINIKWDEIGSYGMNRNYDYATIKDTLLIRYNFNIGRNLYLDSSSVTLFTDTGLNKIYRIFKGVEFDYTNIFFNAKGVLYNERKFEYTGKNITSVKYYGETYYNKSPYPYSFEMDSSICYFTREPQINSFIADVEKKILGKELRILCYDQNDSIGYLLNDYFNYGNWFSISISRSPSQDYFQYENVFNAASDPISNSNINYIIKRDGFISEQQNGYLYKKLVYTLDAMNRISVIKEYDTETNKLITASYFYYP